MLPVIPCALLAAEWVVCFFFGMQIFGNTAMHRLGELTVCVILVIGFLRLVAVVISFAIAWRCNTQSLGQGVLAWVRTVVLESCNVFLAFSIFIPFKWVLAPRLSRAPQSQETVDLLVHGLISNSGVWWLFGRRLRVWNKALVDSVDLGPPFQSIDIAAEVLHRKLLALEALKPRRIILIGHSMGGLAAIACLRNHPNHLVEHVITIGTPHLGSLSALVLPLTNLIEMCPESRWLRQLRTRESHESTARFTSIFSRHDNLVIPFGYGAMRGSSEVEYQGIGHLSLLFDRRICRDVSQRIG
jgi:pimeloyl-ACP methyl ester carboxylesterase